MVKMKTMNDMYIVVVDLINKFDNNRFQRIKPHLNLIGTMDLDLTLQSNKQ